MWDDDFTSKKFELGRIIEREGANELVRGMTKLELENERMKANYERGRVIKTKNIDFFLNCDLMGKDQIDEEMKLNAQQEEEDEDEPEWNDVDIEMLKTEVLKPVEVHQP